MKTFSTITIGLLALSIAGLHAAEPKPEWQNITAELAKTLGVDAPREIPPKEPGGKVQKTAIYMTHFQGLFGLPNGDVGVINNDKGIHRSTDQGATWTKWGEDWMKGVAQSSLSLKVYYPDRIGLTMDGPIAVSSDLGKSWTQIQKPIVTVTKKDTAPFQGDLNVLAGDMDLSANMPPKTILGFVHHGELFGGMFVQTTDGGAKWDWSPPVLRESRCWLRTGVASASTVLRGAVNEDKKAPPTPGIFVSADLGQTWEKVSEYTLHGTCPVHYGPNIYWAAREGIVVSRDGGKTWSVCGSAIENVVFGPYFGTSEQEMMAVSYKEGFSITRDGGKTWKLAAPFFAAPSAWGEPKNEMTSAPTGSRHWRGALWYFGWDAKKDILYAKCFGGDAWKLALAPAVAGASGQENNN